MENMQLPPGAAQLANDVLVWIGFGTLVGLLAKAIMPGRDPGGAVTTLLMGVGGSVIGCGILAFFWEDRRVTPISPVGFVVAVAGAFMLLGFYRLLSGTLHLEGHHTVKRPYVRRTRARRPAAVIHEIHHDE